LRISSILLCRKVADLLLLFWTISREKRAVTFFAVSQQKNAPALCSCVVCGWWNRKLFFCGVAFADSETGIVIFFGLTR